MRCKYLGQLRPAGRSEHECVEGRKEGTAEEEEEEEEESKGRALRLT